MKNSKRKIMGKFDSVKELVIWFIAMVIFIAATIGVLVLGITFKRSWDNDYIGNTCIVIGITLLLVTISMISAKVLPNVTKIMTGMIIILLSVVLPITTEYYWLLFATGIVGVFGFFVLMEGIAKSTKTQDWTYYKKIYAMQEKVVNFIVKRQFKSENQSEKTEKQQKLENVMYDAANVAAGVHNSIQRGILTATCIVVGLLIVLLILIQAYLGALLAIIAVIIVINTIRKNFRI